MADAAKLQQVSVGELLDNRSLWYYPGLADALTGFPDADGAVIYRCEDLSSSQLGTMKAVLYGPSPQLSTKTKEECVEKYKRVDAALVSTTKWPVAYVVRE